MSAPFSGRVTADGSSGFAAAAGRYVLVVAVACPFCARCLIVRKLKGLEEALPVVVSHRHTDHEDHKGWQLALPGESPSPPDAVPFSWHPEFTHVRQLYELSGPYQGRVTVPVLFDTLTDRVVNNESPDIMRMLNSEFDAFARHPEVDLYPPPLRAAVDEVSSWVQSEINTGVYKAGFAATQEAYDAAVDALFAALDRAEQLLSRRRYLTGDRLTEADVRLFASLVRFDPVYVVLFKCSKRRLADYPNLLGFTRDVYQHPGVAETVDLEQIRREYFVAVRDCNPRGIVARPLESDLTAPHGRERLGGQ